MSLYEDYLNKKKDESPNDSKKNNLESIDQEKDIIDREKFMQMVDGKEDDDLKENISKDDDKSNVLPIPPTPIKGSKLWARILVISLIIVGTSVASSLLWWWLIKTPKIITERIVEEIEVVKIVPEIDPPLSYFNYDAFEDISITKEREAPVYLKQYLTNNYEYNNLIKISIRDYTKDNPEFLSLKSFFQNLKVTPPIGLYEKIDNKDFNIFIYSGEQKDIGFAFPVIEGSITEVLGIVLANWEEKMEKDLWGFYSLVEPRGGETAPASTIYRRANIRCKSFRSAHHACFTSLDNNFIITTSLESAKAAVDRNR
jgi:hypothetical protein